MTASTFRVNRHLRQIAFILLIYKRAVSLLHNLFKYFNIINIKLYHFSTSLNIQGPAYADVIRFNLVIAGFHLFLVGWP